MIVSIEDYLKVIQINFNEYLNTSPKLCELKKVNFNSGMRPDYSNINAQQLYLLRYGLAYAFEYKWMLSDLLHNNSFENNISVLSIGCGTMLDYWALKQISPCKITYTGIDQINWNYKMGNPNEGLLFIKKNVIDWIKQTFSLSYDIIIFPMSISEFSDEDFRVICDSFKTKKLKNQFFLLITLRSDPNSFERDNDRSNKLIASFQSNGYTILNNKLINLENESKSFWKYDSSFNMPNGAIELIRDLNTACISYKENGVNCNTDCEELLTRCPVLKPYNIRYKIITFGRQ